MNSLFSQAHEGHGFISVTSYEYLYLRKQEERKLSYQWQILSSEGVFSKYKETELRAEICSDGSYHLLSVHSQTVILISWRFKMT